MTNAVESPGVLLVLSNSRYKLIFLFIASQIICAYWYGTGSYTAIELGKVRNLLPQSSKLSSSDIAIADT